MFMFMYMFMFVFMFVFMFMFMFMFMLFSQSSERFNAQHRDGPDGTGHTHEGGAVAARRRPKGTHAQTRQEAGPSRRRTAYTTTPRSDKESLRATRVARSRAGAPHARQVRAHRVSSARPAHSPPVRAGAAPRRRRAPARGAALERAPIAHAAARDLAARRAWAPDDHAGP